LSWRATEFEFRYRFWIISGIFYLGFGCYIWDRMNVSVAVARMILGVRDTEVRCSGVSFLGRNSLRM
jgi:hypothetical protein